MTNEQGAVTLSDNLDPAEVRYESLSPFELKNKLISMADSHSEKLMLNAGRGNPNWVATTPRAGFFELGHFALQEAERRSIAPEFGSTPSRDGCAARFQEYCRENQSRAGIDFLTAAVNYATNNLGIAPDEFVGEMVDAILGDHYPVPDRILNCTNQVVSKYLDQEMFGGNPPEGRFDLFATEGGTAAMAYIFNSLMENKLLHLGDKIALGSPIFTPYLEIPRLVDYQFVELEIEQCEDQYWQYPDREIEKLADPEVKAFFVVHPSNPTSVAMHPDCLEKIGALVRDRRPDLILLTDDVYGTFVNGFRSLAGVAPRNTILVYSYSKYFGATGWRLGVIGIHEDNVFDEKIAALPEQDRKALEKRYSRVAFEPAKMKLIERMVADSRAVALHHTAGLSTPQQVQMALFSLYCLLDEENQYKANAQKIVAERIRALYDAIGISHPNDPYDTHYYTTIDVPKLARQRYGDEFTHWFVSNHEPIDFVWRLADEKSVVLMDGGGFDAPNMSVRVSLANLASDAYPRIGKAISDLLDEYHARWESAA